MLHYFNWKGKSSKDFGVVIKTLPQIYKAEKQVEKIEILGHNGFLTQDYGSYKGITIELECVMLDISKIREVCAWLDGKGELIVDTELDKKYDAVIINQIPFEQILPKFSNFTIQFDCQPFAKLTEPFDSIRIINLDVTRNGKAINPLESYNFVSGKVYNDNEKIEINKQDFVNIYNRGTIESKPILTIYGSGDIKLHLHYKIIELKDVNEYITINSEIMDAYKETHLLNNKMIGEFPSLNPGSNILKWEGKLLAIGVIQNESFL